MPKPTDTLESVVVAQEEEGSANLFATTSQDISHVTFYFNSGDSENADFYFVKIETNDAVDDDLDHWYVDALDAIIAQNPDVEGYTFLGAAIKYGRHEEYYAADGSDSAPDDVPTGILVHGKDFKSYGGGVTYNYDDLF